MRFFFICLTAVLYNFSVLPSEKNLSLKGDLSQGGLVIGKAPIGTKIKLNNENILVSPKGQFFLGFMHTAKPNQILKAIFPSGKTVEYMLDIKQRDYHTQYIEGLSKRKVLPNPSDLKRIKKENIALRKAFTRLSKTKLMKDITFSWPTQGTITGSYGTSRVLNGVPKKAHLAVDIANPVGTIVHAAASGKILFVHEGMFFNGKTIIIDHGLNLASVYIHLDNITVKLGDLVNKGDEIGTIGRTGRTTGPHLHWELRLGRTKLDPKLAVESMSRIFFEP